MNDLTSVPGIDAIAEGQEYSENVELDETRVSAFIALTGDTAPIHTDIEHAKRMGFPALVVHGLLVAAHYSRMLGMHLPGGNTVIHHIQLDMVQPVFVGETLTYTVSVSRVIAAVKTVKLNLSARKQDGTVVSRGQATCVFKI